MNLGIELISKYRTQLMGIAMLCVVFYHINIPLPFPVIGYLKWICYGGVDIFIILSGMSAYTSFVKNNDIKTFYKKRFKRILPLYIPIILIFLLIFLYLGKIDVIDALLNITGLAFWINNKYQIDWYVPALFFFYLITPFFIKYLGSRLTLAVIVFSIISILISILIASTSFSYLLILTLRVPIYLMGFLIGRGVQAKHIFDAKQVLILIIIIVAGFFFLDYVTVNFSIEEKIGTGIVWYPYIVIVFPLILFISKGMSMFHSYKFPILSFFGTYSLAVYLLHERLINLQYYILPLSKPIHLVVSNLVILLLTVALAYGVTKLTDRLIGKD